MTDDELLAKLKELPEGRADWNWDEQTCHVEADELFCTVLESFGYTKSVAFYRAQDKWYA